MKNLVLIRHSKAEDKSSNDFERKLTYEGKKLAKKVVLMLPDVPDNDAIFITSPALRSFETSKIFADFFSFPLEKISTSNFLYKYFTVEQFFIFIENEYKNYDKLWIFGHNPMLTEIVSFLSNNKFFSMPKCAVASFEINSENWIKTSYKNTELKFFINPKESKLNFHDLSNTKGYEN